MATKKKLPAVPKPKARKESRVEEAAAEQAPPSLDHIADGLRGLAVPIGDLQFDPANTVRHDEKNLDAIRGSLTVYGQHKPVVVRREGMVVVCGNGTLAAALSLGWTHLAANVMDLDAATAAGLSVADNRTSDLHGWDKEALGKLLREVNTGNDERLDAMLADLAKAEGLIPPEEPEHAEFPEIGQTTTHTITLRYADEDEVLLKAFIGQEGPGPLDPQRGGRYILERIKEVVATGADPE